MRVRWLLVALMLFGCSFAARAQPRVEVEVIGFGQYFRPDAWCPVRLRITPDSGESREYQIRIHQRDLDGDEVSFVRTITLTGGIDTEQRRPQKFWTYFRPEPLDGGLPDGRDPTGTLSELRRRLRIELTDRSGRPATSVAINDAIRGVDSVGDGLDGTRGARLVLMVGSRPVSASEYTSDRLLGLLEDTVIVQVPSAQSLPDDAIGYDMVDAIVWLDADAGELLVGGEARLRAIEQYVRGGGRLVVCTPSEPARIAAFSEWLPVSVLRMIDRTEPEPLRSLALTRISLPLPSGAREQFDRWQALVGPFRIAEARPVPGAIVEHWLMPDAEHSAPLPWLARRPLGFGCVTWVAQDLSDPRLTRVALGWSNVWSRVLDYPDDPRPLDQESDRRTYGRGSARDLGVSAVQGLDVTEQSMMLASIALVFFVLYWALAGPVSHFWLASRKRTSWSWAAFAAIALAATGVTLVVVALVVRGPPELRHVSVVRTSVATNAESLVQSRLGLYIPSNGSQELSVAQADAIGWIGPLAMHPRHLLDRTGVLSPDSYRIDLDDADAVEVPFRSTLRKLQAEQSVPAEPAVVGFVRTAATHFFDGKLTNQTGQTLRNVYLIARESSLLADQMLHVPEWKPGETLDINALFAALDPNEKRYPIVPDFGNTPDNGRLCRGRLNSNWAPWWFSQMGGGFGESGWNDSGSATPISVPLLSIFNRLAPARNTGQGRVELLRRGARHWDASAAVSAGAMLIVATSDGVPLPLALSVNGREVAGRGRTIWQFIVPVARGAPTPPEPIPALSEPVPVEQ
jgi:hypothetical protein